MLAIIIINYKNERLTIGYIQDELCKIAIPHITIVVNNAATDNSNHYLCEALNSTLVYDINAPFSHNENNVYVISSEDNLGFAKGNNLGVKFLAQHFVCEYVLFSNNDIQIVDADVCELLIRKMSENNRIGMIGPKVLGLKGECQSPEAYMSFLDRYCWMYLSTPFISKKRKIKRFQLDYSAKAQEGEHYKVSGSFFIVCLNDYLNCGMMDPNTFLYAEETILSERLKKINKCVYYLPTVSVIHAHGLTTKKAIGKMGINKYMMESEKYYYHEYMKTPKWKLIFGEMVYRIYCKLKD